MTYTRTLSLVGLVALPALWISCEEAVIPTYPDAFTPAPAVELTVDKDALDFGSVRADQGEDATLNVKVTNNGGTDARLTGFYLSGETGSFWVEVCERVEEVSDTTPTTTPPSVYATTRCELPLPAGATTDVPINFKPDVQSTPETCGPRLGTVTLVFSSTVTPNLTISLTGVGESDTDEDGALCAADADCDDTLPLVYPGADELCNGEDDDCDGTTPADEADGDRDGYRGCEGDCDDAERDANPGETEVADSIDNDCDGDVDEDTTRAAAP